MKNIQNTHKVGVDLAKNVIQVYAVDEVGQATMNRRLSRAKALESFEKLQPVSLVWNRAAVRITGDTPFTAGVTGS